MERKGGRLNEAKRKEGRNKTERIRGTSEEKELREGRKRSRKKNCGN